MLHDGPLPSHGLQRLAHCPELSRLAEAQLDKRATAKVNALIQAPTPYNRTQTNDEHDNRTIESAIQSLAFPRKSICNQGGTISNILAEPHKPPIDCWSQA